MNQQTQYDLWQAAQHRNELVLQDPGIRKVPGAALKRVSGIDIDKSAGQAICTDDGCRVAVGYRDVPDEHDRSSAVSAVHCSASSNLARDHADHTLVAV